MTKMMRYRFDVKFTGYTTVSVEADSYEQAQELAFSHFEEVYSSTPVSDLRNKDVELIDLDEHTLGVNG